MDTDLVIRYAGTEDIPLIRAMADVAFRATYREILSPEQMEYMLDWMYSEASLGNQMKDHRFFVAEQAGQPCGYLSLGRQGVSDEGRVQFHLDKIYVLPDAQRKHIGDALFERAVSFVRKSCRKSPARILLNVNRHNANAIAFYRRKGMGVLREGDFPIGNGYYMNDYIMFLDI